MFKRIHTISSLQIGHMSLALALALAVATATDAPVITAASPIPITAFSKSRRDPVSFGSEICDADVCELREMELAEGERRSGFEAAPAAAALFGARLLLLLAFRLCCCCVDVGGGAGERCLPLPSTLPPPRVRLDMWNERRVPMV